MDVGKTTAKSAATGYIMTYSSSALKGIWQNSSKGLLRTLSKTNLPGIIVSTTLHLGSSFIRLAKVEINTLEFFEQIGENGVGMGSSVMYAIAGQLLIPIPGMGALIGGMIGYSFSTALYRGTIEIFKDAKLAKEERILIEAECRENIVKIKEYRAEMEVVISQYFTDNYNAFNDAFLLIEDGINFDDIDLFIKGTNTITKQVGGNVLFNNFNEFDNFMQSDETLRI